MSPNSHNLLYTIKLGMSISQILKNMSKNYNHQIYAKISIKLLGKTSWINTKSSIHSTKMWQSQLKIICRLAEKAQKHSPTNGKTLSQHSLANSIQQASILTCWNNLPKSQLKYQLILLFTQELRNIISIREWNRFKVTN